MQLSPRSVSLVELEATEPTEARRMEEARTRACDNLCPQVNTHTFLSSLLAGVAHCTGSWQVTQRNTLTK